MGLAAALLAALALLALPARSGAVPAGHGGPLIVGGRESTISQFPWQVFILTQINNSEAITCGGSVIEPTRILTAAHCVTHEGTTTPYPAERMVVFAGVSDISEILKGTLPPGSQKALVGRVRVHPYYATLPNIKDDVAVLTLSAPLTISPAANTAVIPIVPEGQTPAAGTAVSVSGYGKEDGQEEALPSGGLFSTSMNVVGSDQCRNLVEPNSAVILCAEAPTSTTCQGDSGGPLTAGSPAVEVGIVDFGPAGCPIGRPSGFTNLAAPEVQAFIHGSETPPVAARVQSPPVLHSRGAAPVDYSPLTCEPGTWSGSPTFTYTFLAETPTGQAQVAQSGTSSVFVPAGGAVGLAVTCVVQAANSGGVSTARSTTTQAVGIDGARPYSTFSGPPRCTRRTCTVQVSAADPNAESVSLTVTASYPVTRACRIRRAGRLVTGRCVRTSSRPMSVTSPYAGVYEATATGLPYGVRIRFTAAAQNAAGLRQGTSARISVILRAPRTKGSKH